MEDVLLVTAVSFPCFELQLQPEQLQPFVVWHLSFALYVKTWLISQ